MQHLGQILQQQIETNHLKKRDVATAAEISLNYLSVLSLSLTHKCPPKTTPTSALKQW